MGKAKWIKNEHRWKLRVQINKTEHVFTSKRSGAVGKKECEEKYRLYCEKNVYEPDYVRADMTIDSVYERYLRYCESRYGKDSYPYYDAERTGRLYLLPALTGRKMKSIRLDDFQNIINTARPASKPSSEKPLSKKYLSTMRYNFNAFIKWAYQNDYCSGFKGELYIPYGRPVYGKEVLQPEDLKRLMEPAPEIWFHSLMCFLALSGCRPGEGLGLQVSDYNGKTVTINRSVNYKGQITPGKNKNARRIIPLCDKAIRIIEDTIARNRNEGLETDWIFCGIDGGPGKQCTVEKQWNKLKEARQLPGTPYSLRGTWISLFKNDMTAQQIKSIVGHSDSMPTFDVYSKALDGELDVQRSIINRVVDDYLT